jgi:hypothetical protein
VVTPQLLLESSDLTWSSSFENLVPLIYEMPRSEASLGDLYSDDSYDSDEDFHLAQLEWEESLQQLQQLFSVVVLPFFGKWLGRRWSYWGQPCDLYTIQSFNSPILAYARYLRLGLGKSFFLGERVLATAVSR